MNVLIRLYDFFADHPWLRRGVLAVLVVLLVLSLMRLRFREDISDFLPDSEDREQLMHSPDAGKIVFIFSLVDTTQADPDRLCDAIDAVPLPLQTLPLEDEAARYFRTLPYVLTDSDYARIDRALHPDSVHRRLLERKAWLQVPLSGMLAPLMAYDPLNLFPLPQTNGFTLYDGYMFAKDRKTAFAFYTSAHGTAETQRNSLLVDSLTAVISALSCDYPDVSIRLNGAPVAAVTNARQIKRDSVLALTLAAVLIALLLYYSLHSWRSLWLIVFAVAFGLLFALGLMAWIHPEMSLIVPGIAAVLVGIAVNYPLHLIVHRQYTLTMRETLQQVLSPLLVGNVTTVGAFLALLPLRSVALRDLGLFCALMLMGTILFTVVFLPHYRFATPRFDRFSWVSRLMDRTSSWQPERHKGILALVAALTILFAIFAPRVRFDANLSHINYLTSQQRADFALVERLMPKSTLVTDSPEQWNRFWESRRDTLIARTNTCAEALGFRQGAFLPFEHLLSDAPAPSPDSMQRLQQTVTSSLRDSFDYIGAVCSLIVFVFLWLSFRRLRFALAAFLPMVVAWVWILGIMGLTGMQFNIVNVILATFIFGQGDDYTIFITEGYLTPHSQGEEQRLQQYKNAVILSALIMFIGMGALIVSRHPAMHSLACLTLLGMTCVVVMAYIVPPLVLRPPFLRNNKK